MSLPIKLSDTAQNTITSIIDYIDSINTKGAGWRWYVRFKKKLLKITTVSSYPLCRFKEFAIAGYSCISIDNWIIVFKIEQKKFYIQHIIYGTILY